MGTRGEIYVRNSSATVELWRHYDTYPEFMVPYFKGFAKFAAWCVGSQRHWLTYPEDVASMLIAYDYELTLAHCLRYPLTEPFTEARPDLRPRGKINDFEIVWILDIPNANQTAGIVWRVRGFKHKYGTNAEEMREAIKRKEDDALKHYLTRVSSFKVKPENSGGCRHCGYPGPLLVAEGPPTCIYCLLRQARSDDFIRSEVERAFKIVLLIR